VLAVPSGSNRYLASDESRFMTGAEMKLDGGISAM